VVLWSAIVLASSSLTATSQFIAIVIRCLVQVVQGFWVTEDWMLDLLDHCDLYCLRDVLLHLFGRPAV